MDPDVTAAQGGDLADRALHHQPALLEMVSFALERTKGRICAPSILRGSGEIDAANLLRYRAAVTV
jgi:hypothetical protein